VDHDEPPLPVISATGEECVLAVWYPTSTHRVPERHAADWK
jgi:hypothetical protein